MKDKLTTNASDETQSHAFLVGAVGSSLFHKIEIILLSPFWFFSISPTRKTWKEFKSGLIKHICKYDYSRPNYDMGKHYKCEHLGCNIVSVKNEDGSLC